MVSEQTCMILICRCDRAVLLCFGVVNKQYDEELRQEREVVRC